MKTTAEITSEIEAVAQVGGTPEDYRTAIMAILVEWEEAIRMDEIEKSAVAFKKLGGRIGFMD